jgi:holo-[acyl-carrier-protein] synthase
MGMIFGIGVDILDTRRFEGVISRQKERFISKIFTLQEREFCSRRLRVNESFSKIFSIKEAVLKAISNTSGIFWKDIEVFHDQNGKPFVELKNAALANLITKINGRSFVIEVSVSDEIPYVCAFVVIDIV